MLRLANSAQTGIPSWLGLLVTEAGTDKPIMMATSGYCTGETPAHSSLRLDVASSVHDGRSHAIVFLAAEPHAFDEFRQFRSADVEKGSAGTTIVRLVVDGDVPGTGTRAAPPAADDDVAAAEHIIEQAVGILLDRGVSDGRARLTVRAEASSSSLLEQAHSVLASLPNCSG